MIHVVIIVVTVAPDVDPMWEYIREYQERQNREFMQKVEELRQSSHKLTCDRCGLELWGYSSPGRAKMALSGHQRWCKKR
jgi:hypothetical protein